MATTLNAGTTTATALNVTTDTTGAMVIQTSGTNAISISSSQVVSLTNALLPASGGTGITSLGSGVSTFLGTPSSANLAAAVTDETGSGSLVFATSPTLVTPILGTPTSGTLTNVTGLPLTTGVTGTLPTANGGTNLTSFTSGGAVYATSTSVLTTGILPVASGGTGVTTSTGSGANVLGTDPTITGAVLSSMASSVLTSATAQTAPFTAPNTFANFFGIPSWAKRVTVMLNGISTNGTSPLQIQLGTASGVESTGYASTPAIAAGDYPGVAAANTSTTAFVLQYANLSAAQTLSGQYVITNLSGNTWVISGMIGTVSLMWMSTGSKTLASTLERVRLTTVGGASTFDAGTINILYE
jgi:hypothetical protein